jgi:hypothetical protein
MAAMLPGNNSMADHSDPTDALFADQSQSILDNLLELLGQI